MRKSIFILMLAACSVSAQEQATTNSGKKVNLNIDGTWSYVQEQPQEATECDAYVSIKVDKMTKKSSASANNSVIIEKGTKGLGINIFKAQGVIVFVFTVIGANPCIDDDNNVIILFKDGSTSTMKNNGDFNCKNKFTLYLGDIFKRNQELEKISSVGIESVRVWTTGGYVEVDLSDDESQTISQTVNCLNQALVD
jgi:hypothetical protein